MFSIGNTLRTLVHPCYIITGSDWGNAGGFGIDNTFSEAPIILGGVFFVVSSTSR